MKIRLKKANVDKILCDNKWLQLKEKDGHYVYSHEVRCHGKIVLILPYRRTGKDGWEFLVREEITPCWSEEPTRSAMTGGNEGGDPVDDAIRELKEEAGYDATKDDMIFLGKCRASKSSDTWYYLYSVDLAGKEPGEAEGDGSKNDKAPAVWINDVSQLEDAQAAMAYLKLSRKIGC